VAKSNERVADTPATGSVISLSPRPSRGTDHRRSRSPSLAPALREVAFVTVIAVRAGVRRGDLHPHIPELRWSSHAAPPRRRSRRNCRVSDDPPSGGSLDRALNLEPGSRSIDFWRGPPANSRNTLWELSPIVARARLLIPRSRHAARSRKLERAELPPNTRSSERLRDDLDGTMVRILPAYRRRPARRTPSPSLWRCHQLVQ
jgi:hypothetical protein